MRTPAVSKILNAKSKAVLAPVPTSTLGARELVETDI
jgi:hypothetical protein